MKESDLDWLVRNRSAIQELLLELWKEFPDTPALDSQPRAILQLLVGAAFSLWRGASLAGTARDWQENASHSKKFLYMVVKDNAIGSSQERETGFWTVGYYLNNACLRLDMAYRMLDYSPPLRTSIADFLKLHTAATESPADPREPWELAHRAAYDLLNETRRRLTQS
ncbi:hypothetical protein W02_27880 [Nitrospira sp. KM1]|uniref:hypothetical protein n=1 Tax=Nitrospira sp. KM1 TaxID=1936990 RepID=UPI0013A7714D|nr:hypothetical protein [Nitrospira sp. KM1]BCA55648.1 hypothetical protein W02_27880 [Nitrospira sp. KM1]